MMRIGIIGGTFDPIHNGHLIMGEYARTSLGLDKVIFIPVGKAPHKDNSKISDSKTRVEMVNLAIESNEYFYQSLIEIERRRTTYTIDTIRSLNKKYANDELYFIMGRDSIFSIESWKESKELMKLCKFIVLDRGSGRKDDIEEKILQLREGYKMDVEMVSSPIIEISSTEIRNRVKDNLSIKYLVPENLEEYINKNKLYL